MSKFYLTIVQAVLLYGAGSWVVTKRSLGKLQRFHKRALRHMTGRHIVKDGEGNWTYPDHRELLEKCGLLPIEVYIARRRGTVRKYFETYKKDLLDEVERLGPPARDPHKVLWWRQEWISREETGTRDARR